MEVVLKNKAWWPVYTGIRGGRYHFNGKDTKTYLKDTDIVIRRSLLPDNTVINECKSDIVEVGDPVETKLSSDHVSIKHTVTKVSPKKSPLDHLNVVDLKKIAKWLDLKGYSRMCRADIVPFIARSLFYIRDRSLKRDYLVDLATFMKIEGSSTFPKTRLENIIASCGDMYI